MHFKKKAYRNGNTVNHPPIDLIFLFLQYLGVLFFVQHKYAKLL